MPAYTLSQKHRDLNILYRATTRTITGLPKHTRIDILEQAAQLPPLTSIAEETQLRHQQRLDLTPRGQALRRWDLQNSEVDLTLIPFSIPPWDRRTNGIVRRKPIPRRNTAVRERYIRKRKRDKGPDELDIFTDASLDGAQAAIAWACPEHPALNGRRQIAHTYGLAKEAELLGILAALQLQRSAPTSPSSD